MPLQKRFEVGKGRKKRGQGLTVNEKGAKTNCKCMMLRPVAQFHMLCEYSMIAVLSQCVAFR